jgi:hypothetical protein
MTTLTYNNEQKTTIKSLKEYIIYEIRPLNKTLNYSYIGSTISFRSRKSHHKKDCETSNLKLYQFIRDNGGWSEFEMVAIEKYFCKNITDAHIREQYFINNIEKSALNMRRAYISDEDKKIYNKDYKKVNQELIKTKNKEYNKNNKGIIYEKQKIYREVNKNERMKKIICICGKQYIKCNLSRHTKRKFHLSYISTLSNI